MVAKQARALGDAPLRSFVDIVADTKRVENYRLIEWLLDIQNTG